MYKLVDNAVIQYMLQARIDTITGNISVTPPKGNAPHRVTLSANVQDNSGAELYPYNYQWYINDGGRRRIIGHGVHLYYTFEREGKHTVFLHVTSNNKNSKGNIITLPFEASTVVDVEPKMASIVLNINGVSLGNNEEIKFTPEEAGYGLLFDATSSTPIFGTRFSNTEWDF